MVPGLRSHPKAQLEKLLLPKSCVFWQCRSPAAARPRVSLSCELLAGGHPWRPAKRPCPWSAHEASEKGRVLGTQMSQLYAM